MTIEAKHTRKIGVFLISAVKFQIAVGADNNKFGSIAAHMV